MALVGTRIPSTATASRQREIPSQGRQLLTGAHAAAVPVIRARASCDPSTLSKEIIMLKRIAILTGLIAAFGAHTALATPTLNLHGYPPSAGAPETSAVPRAADRSTVAHERGWDSASLGQSPNAPFTWNP
jgi:hypothetical protein